MATQGQWWSIWLPASRSRQTSQNRVSATRQRTYRQHTLLADVTVVTPCRFGCITCNGGSNVRLRHCGMRVLAGCLYMFCRTWRTRRRGGGLHPSPRYATLPFPRRLPSGVSPGHRRAQHERRTNTQQVDELGVPYRRREYATEVVEQDVEQDPAANNDVGPPLTVGAEQDTSAPQAVPPPTTSAPQAPARQQLPKKAHTRAHAHTHTHARRERTSGSRQA